MNVTPVIVANWLRGRKWFNDDRGLWLNYAMTDSALTWEQAVALEIVVADVSRAILEKVPN